jgi:PKHD-type hydroxylase
MQHVLTPYAASIEPYVWWEGAFTEKELDWLQQQAKNADQRAIVGGNTSDNALNNIRRSQVSWLNKTPDAAWVFDKLAHVVSSLNAQFFRFDLTGFGEAIQLTNYDQSEHGMYGWHQDYNGGTGSPSRKFSLVLQLTDPAQYEGGNLEIMSSAEPVTVQKKRGFIAAFPSYQLHQVTPVTQGSRQSLVAWITGPSFR